MLSHQLLSELIYSLFEEIIEEKKKKSVNPAYLTSRPRIMRKEIQKNADKRDDDPSAYDTHPKGDWYADYDSKGKRIKTKVSKWTTAARKAGLEEALELEDNFLLWESLGSKVRKALKNKADNANLSLGALTTVYRKGLAAWKTGHRPGVTPHQWAMGRVNSFIMGGPARKVDAAQWKQAVKRRKK